MSDPFARVVVELPLVFGRHLRTMGNGVLPGVHPRMHDDAVRVELTRPEMEELHSLALALSRPNDTRRTRLARSAALAAERIGKELGRRGRACTTCRNWRVPYAASAHGWCELGGWRLVSMHWWLSAAKATGSHDYCDDHTPGRPELRLRAPVATAEQMAEHRASGRPIVFHPERA